MTVEGAAGVNLQTDLVAPEASTKKIVSTHRSAAELRAEPEANLDALSVNASAVCYWYFRFSLDSGTRSRSPLNRDLPYPLPLSVPAQLPRTASVSKGGGLASASQSSAHDTCTDLHITA